MRAIAVFLLTSSLLSAIAKLPVAFEPNHGQADRQIQYTAHGRGYLLTLQSDRAELVSRSARITARLIGAAAGQGWPEAALPGTVNYLVGNTDNWHIGIPTYSRVRYRDAWPGIDVIYYGSDGRLEYDFVLAPPAAFAAFPHDDRAMPDRRWTIGEHTCGAEAVLAYAGMAVFAELPGTVLPVGAAGHLPVGLQVIGDRFRDRDCIAMATAIGALLA